MRHQLGLKGTDKITGFTGILTSRVEYITGCTQYGITPIVIEGKLQQVEYFDEGRVEISGCGILPEEILTETNGGPNRDSPKH